MIELILCCFMDYRLLCPDYRLCDPPRPTAGTLPERVDPVPDAKAGSPATGPGGCVGGRCAVPPRGRLLGGRARR